MHEAHHHYCPDCSERPLCHEDCDTERNLDGALRGGTVMCDRCAAARVAAAPRGAASTKQQLAELREAARAFLDAFALQCVGALDLGHYGSEGLIVDLDIHKLPPAAITDLLDDRHSITRSGFPHQGATVSRPLDRSSVQDRIPSLPLSYF